MESPLSGKIRSKPEIKGLLQSLEGEARLLLESLARMGADACSTPMAFISLIEGDSAYYGSAVGFTTDGAGDSPCPWPILSSDFFAVPDTALDPRLKDTAIVTSGPGIRFYAGAALISAGGKTLGAVCVLDLKPRVLSPSQVERLRTIASLTSAQIELRRKNMQLERELNDRQRALDSILESQRRSIQVLRSTNDGLFGWNLKTDKMNYCPRWKALLGYEQNEISDSPDEWFARVHQEDVQSLRSEIAAHLSGATP
ncbi:MAG TPA: GAF domain-containing protein, partial [Blastocatellia bacterium]|nr:GAF domain-containing protein [Blastocatellia bacterium]